MSDSDQSATCQQRPRKRAYGLLVSLALGTAGCMHLDTRPGQPATAKPTAAMLPFPRDPGEHLIADDIDAQTVVLPLGENEPHAGAIEITIWQRLRRGYRLQSVSHPRIVREIRRLRRAPNALHAMLARAEPYLRYILDQVEQAHLPTELALLPAVESGFRPHVYSPDGAAGLWQFMPATGRMLGLGQDWWFDKRRALRASTPAALRYLQRLNKRFAGDWLHTLAAYNAGSRKVSQAIVKARRRGESTHFWSLDLPGETDDYVPRLLALAAVIADPEAYGLDLPEIIDRPYFAVAATAGQIDLNVAARLASMPIEELMGLNAGHKRWASRPDGPHELLLPAAKVAEFEQAVRTLSSAERLRWKKHRIRRGDSLIRIAREYGVGVDVIRRANDLQDSRIRAGRDLLIPLSDSVASAETLSNPQARRRLQYRVRKGDSLYTIARRFAVSIADLKRWNRVGRYIQPGERLTVFIDPDA